MMMSQINRRRFITISAAAGMAGSIPVFAETPSELIRWQGAALGGQAQIKLYGLGPAAAQKIFQKCQQEITRLEKIFSLYRADSALSQLNRDGHLDNPPLDFLNLLSRCLSCYEITGGAFDVTIQPLWQLYADHFAKPTADPVGPSEDNIRQTVARVGSDKIIMTSRRISFAKPGMGMSLNGVAQGYMTDRIVALLRHAGLTNALVHMGETYAMGQHEDGRPWTAGIASPLEDHKSLMTLPLKNQALATSGGYGSPFSDQSALHHLLDPRTGHSANHHGAVSVVAGDATTADMLSTAFYVMPYEKVSGVWPQYPALEKAIFVNPAGKITVFTGR